MNIHLQTFSKYVVNDFKENILPALTTLQKRVCDLFKELMADDVQKDLEDKTSLVPHAKNSKNYPLMYLFSNQI